MLHLFLFLNMHTYFLEIFFADSVGLEPHFDFSGGMRRNRAGGGDVGEG